MHFLEAEVRNMTTAKKGHASSSGTTSKQRGPQHDRHGGAQKGATGGARMPPRGGERQGGTKEEEKPFDAPGAQRPPSDS